MAEMKFTRISVGDVYVCDDCLYLEDTEENTLEWWHRSGLMPRVAPTECHDRCRCGLTPSTLDGLVEASQNEINKAILEGFGKKITDQVTGRQIILKDFERFQGIIDHEYEYLIELENLIYQWKELNRVGKKLAPMPVEFWKLGDLDLMRKWLEDRL